jgi:C4-dicarboxylate transporter DctQ subunit
MDALVQAVPGRAAHLMKVLVNLGCGLFCVVVVYYGTLHCLKLHRFGVRTSAMQIPMYVPYLSIPVFSATMGLRFFGKMVFHLKAFIKNEPFKT